MLPYWKGVLSDGKMKFKGMNYENLGEGKKKRM